MPWGAAGVSISSQGVLQDAGGWVTRRGSTSMVPPHPARVPAVSVAHIEAVREGRQSEGLRKHGAAFPERHCFTLAFKGRRKNLDLAARGEEDARHWVQGLTKLMGRLQAMSQMEKLDQYPLRELWGLGDRLGTAAGDAGWFPYPGAVGSMGSCSEQTGIRTTRCPSGR